MVPLHTCTKPRLCVKSAKVWNPERRHNLLEKFLLNSIKKESRIFAIALRGIDSFAKLLKLLHIVLWSVLIIRRELCCIPSILLLVFIIT